MRKLTIVSLAVAVSVLAPPLAAKVLPTGLLAPTAAQPPTPQPKVVPAQQPAPVAAPLIVPKVPANVRVVPFATPVPKLMPQAVLDAMRLKAQGDIETPVTLSARTPYSAALGGYISGSELGWSAPEDVVSLHTVRMVGPYAAQLLPQHGAIRCNIGLDPTPNICGAPIQYIPATPPSKLFVGMSTVASKRYLVDCTFAANPAITSRYGPIDLNVWDGTASSRRQVKDVMRVQKVIEGAPAREVVFRFDVEYNRTDSAVSEARGRDELELSLQGCTIYPSRPGVGAAPP
jgi:hypothetical protein